MGSNWDCRKWGKSGRMDKKEARPSRGAFEPRLRNDVSGFALVATGANPGISIYKNPETQNSDRAPWRSVDSRISKLRVGHSISDSVVRVLVNPNVAGAGFDANCRPTAVELARNMMTIRGALR
jgi:hypothetical protein